MDERHGRPDPGQRRALPRIRLHHIRPGRHAARRLRPPSPTRGCHRARRTGTACARTTRPALRPTPTRRARGRRGNPPAEGRPRLRWRGGPLPGTEPERTAGLSTPDRSDRGPIAHSRGRAPSPVGRAQDGPDPRDRARATAAAGTIHTAGATVAVPLVPQMYPSRTRDESQLRHRRQHDMPICRVLRELADGLEPSTPSLPCRAPENGRNRWQESSPCLTRFRPRRGLDLFASVRDRWAP